MSIIDKYREFRKNRHIQAIANSIKLVQNPRAIKEDRVAAIEFLAELDVSNIKDAVHGLLQRFEYSLEHGIQDSREKEQALTGIVRFQALAIPYLNEHLKQTTRIAWPIKALTQLAKPEAIVEVLASCLEFGDVSLEQSRVDKNYDILC